MHIHEEKQSFKIKKINGLALQETTFDDKTYYKLELSQYSALKDFKLENLDNDLVVAGDITTGMNFLVKSNHNVDFVGNISGIATIINPTKRAGFKLVVQGSVLSKGDLKVYSPGKVVIEGDSEQNSSIIAKDCEVEVQGKKEGKIQSKDNAKEFASSQKTSPSSFVKGNDKVSFAKAVSPQAPRKTVQHSPLMQKLKKQMQKEMGSKFPKLEKMPSAPSPTPKNMFAQIQAKLSEPANKQKHNSTQLIDTISMHAQRLQKEKEQRSDDLMDAELNKWLYEVNDVEEAAIHEASELFNKQRPEILARLSQFIESIKQKTLINLSDTGEKLKLKNPQVDAFEAFYKFLTEMDKQKYKHNTGHITAATGFGKSVFITAMSLVFNGSIQSENIFNINPSCDFPILIVVSRSILIEQLKLEFQEYAPNLKIGFYDGDPNHKDTEQAITITTYNSFQIQMQKPYEERDLKIEKYRALVLDEAHHGLAKGVQELIKRFFNSAFVFGFTATPEFNNVREPGALSSLNELLGHCIFEYSLRQGITDGLLSPCLNVIVDVEHGIDIKSMLNPQRKKADYSDEELAKLKSEKFNRIPVDIYKRYLISETNELLLGKPGIGFAFDRLHAKQIVKLFNEEFKNHPYFKENKIKPAAYIGSDLSPHKIKSRLEKYRQGKIAWLWCADYLNEGFDSNLPRIIFNMRPTRSIVRAVQIGGRGLRLGDGPTVIIDVNLGLEQIFFSRFLNGRHSYGNICKSEKFIDITAYPVSEMMEVESYTIRSGLSPNTYVFEKLKEVKDVEEMNDIPQSYATITVDLQGCTLPDYYTGIEDLVPSFQPASEPTVVGNKRDYDEAQVTDAEFSSFFKRFRATLMEEEMQSAQFGFEQ